MKVVWTNPALNDLDEIQDYIAQDNPKAAFKLTARLLKQAGDILSVNPMAGRSGRIRGTREWVVPQTAYVIAYRVTGRVEILAVIHAARDWPESL